MKNIQKNRLTKNRRVKSSVEDAVIAPVLAGITEFPSLKSSLDNQIVKVDALQLKQENDLKLLNANRMTGRNKTVFVCLQLAAALLALGTKTENNELILEASINKSGLRKLNHADLAAKAAALLALGVAHSPELAIYLITPSFLDNMETTINEFSEAIDAANTGRDRQKQCTEDIELSLKDSDIVIGRVALIMETLKEAYPESYATFRNACRIINTGGSSVMASGTVLDAETGEAISRCRIKITAFELLEEPPADGEENEGSTRRRTPSYTDMIKSVKFTSTKGAFRYKNLADGTYEVTAFRSGYSNTKTTFYVNRGECAEVYLRMQKVKKSAA
jgi:hypothetical protein